MSKKILFGALLALGFLGFGNSAYAAPGDSIVRIPRIFYNTNGVLFDGQHIRISHFPANPPQGNHGEIVTINESTGQPMGTICLSEPGFPCGALGVGGIAWDSTRNGIWAVVTDFTQTSGNYNWQIKLFDPITGQHMQTCGSIDPAIAGDAYGLGYDPATDTLWYDGDKTVSYHFSTACQLLDTVASPGVATESTAPGEQSCFFRSYSDPQDPLSLGRGDNLLAQMKPDGTMLWKARTVMAEDNAYESAGRYGVPVVWIVDDSDDSITAFEVPSTDCVPPLSVTWRYYYATCALQGINIFWETLSESDTLGFVIERSSSATGPFTAISPPIEAHGPFTPYQWLDLHPLMHAANWYRIREFTSSGPGDVSNSFTMEEQRCSSSGN